MTYELINREVCNLCQSRIFKTILDEVEDNVIAKIIYDGEIIQCINCGQGYLNPYPNERTIGNAYLGYYTQLQRNNTDKFFRFKLFYDYVFYSKFSFIGFFLYLLYRILPGVKFYFERAIRFMNYDSKQNILDVGCGQGIYLDRVRNYASSVYGIDLDEKAINIAKNNNLNVEITNLKSFRTNKKFSFITINHVIEHLTDPIIDIKRAYDLLDFGGVMFIATPNLNSSGRKIFKRYWRGIDAPRHLTYFNIETLTKLLSKSGFKNIQLIRDIPQSFGILKSSYRILSGKEKNIFLKIKIIMSIIFSNPLKISNLEVIVIKCYKL